LVSNKSLFYLIFILVTFVFSIIGNTQTDVVIVGPDFEQQDYFIEELEAISIKTGYKITYIPLNDVHAYLNNNLNEPDMAILTDIQSLKILGESETLLPVNQFYSQLEIENYSQHLIDLVSSEDNSELYGHWIRLFNNSLIWFNVDRYNQYGAPEFKTFDEIIEFTKENSKEGNELWCLTIDSAENQPLLDYEYGESSGWIISNWLESIVLSNYGPEIYDLWSQNELKFSDQEIILSLLDVGKIIHNENQIFKGKEYFIRSQVSNSPKNLASDSSTCVFSLSGHHSINDFPSDKNFGEDYDFFNFPSDEYSEMVIGFGDTLSLLNYDKPTVEVYKSLISSDFGEVWASKQDTLFISSRSDFNLEAYNNPLASKQFIQIRDSLKSNLFRYDASMLMLNGTGKKILWTSLRKFATLSNDYLPEITEEIDMKIKREIFGK
jgi:alpha-glucoside transport system substrate-binding protein